MSANRSSPDRVYLGACEFLLVDSSQSIRVLVTTMLEDYGASVTAVGTADEALEVLERERPEVLLSAWRCRTRGLLAHRQGSRPAARTRGRDAGRRAHWSSPVPRTEPASCAPGSSTTSRAGHLGQPRRDRRAAGAESSTRSARLNAGIAAAWRGQTIPEPPVLPSPRHVANTKLRDRSHPQVGVRVIAGALKGRRLVTPRGATTRPTADQVRIALMDTLGPWLPDARLLDLFAGAGGVGSRRSRAARPTRRSSSVTRARLPRSSRISGRSTSSRGPLSPAATSHASSTGWRRGRAGSRSSSSTRLYDRRRRARARGARRRRADRAGRHRYRAASDQAASGAGIRRVARVSRPSIRETTLTFFRARRVAYRRGQAARSIPACSIRAQRSCRRHPAQPADLRRAHRRGGRQPVEAAALLGEGAAPR